MSPCTKIRNFNYYYIPKNMKLLLIEFKVYSILL